MNNIDSDEINQENRSRISIIPKDKRPPSYAEECALEILGELEAWLGLPSYIHLHITHDLTKEQEEEYRDFPKEIEEDELADKRLAELKDDLQKIETIDDEAYEKFEKLPPPLAFNKDNKLLRMKLYREDRLRRLLEAHMNPWVLRELVYLMIDEFKSAQGKINALKRHRENYQLQEKIYKWLDENKTASMSLDKAAEIMANKVVPLGFRAVRRHCTEWNKLRAASRE